MVNSELGNKHLCTECGARFYDLGRQPPTCPKCDTVVAAVTKPRPSRSRSTKTAMRPVPVKKGAVDIDTSNADRGDKEEDDTPTDEASDDDDDNVPEAPDKSERDS